MDASERSAAFANYERRIGSRHEIAVPITWHPARVGRWRGRGRAKPIAATTDNLSLSGAGFESDHRPELRVISMISITIGDATGDAQIRTIRPTDEPGRSYYGVAFHDEGLVGAARALITEHLDEIAAQRPPSTDEEPVLPSPSDYRAWP